MIVAIINQTSPVGIVAVRDFREAASEQDAVDDFCASFAPPLNPADYLGFDSGWNEYQYPASGNHWSYDFGAPGLLQQPNAPVFDFAASSKMVGDPVAVTDPADWQDLAGVVSSPDFFDANLQNVIGRCVGSHKTDVTGGAPELRIIERHDDGSPDTILSANFTLPAAGTWKNFAFNTNTPPGPGQNVYVLQGRLNGGLSCQVRYVSVSLLKKRGG